MIDLQYVIDLIDGQYGFSAEWARAKEPLAQNIPQLPKVFVWHFSVRSNESPMAAPEAYEQQAESFVFTFETQLICPVQQLHVHWVNLRKLLLGRNPSTLDQNYSSINHLEGGQLGLDGAKVWWADRWRISSPIVTQL